LAEEYLYFLITSRTGYIYAKFSKKEYSHIDKRLGIISLSATLFFLFSWNILSAEEWSRWEEDFLWHTPKF